ncbi:Cytochrome-450 hydroxylase [Mycena indigotica]|uniref:Cytochrome-450 hydroxylase n=1 Tax=Mycena indigotica TaxID=2126181 RepID=A0A8H6TAU2_9AGAR|nr:Cytochrome-450 hydroxylase [Mycena indigotica]KAF7315365.1 Cytochrome-450 hydroxylase [Mycena indigotica]
MLLLLFALSPLAALILFVLYRLIIARFFNVLNQLRGPPVSQWFGNHLEHVLNPSVTPRVYELFIQRYGRAVKIRGFFPWDERVLILDPVALSHIMKDTTTYEKPWESRTLITSIIGCGMLSAEGQMHRRQRRVAMPAFSGQNMQTLVDIVFKKGVQLKDVWENMTSGGEAKIDVCQFLSRATFDIIGLAGFDYTFNAIHDETNELFLAYRNAFEVFISQGGPFRTLLSIYLPSINKLFADETVRTVQRSQRVIRRVAGRLIQEKKQKIEAGELSGDPYDGKDLLTLLLKSNASHEVPFEQRLSDEDILHNINTFMFAGSDTSSLSMTWTLLLLAQNPIVQARLRDELLSVASQFPASFSDFSPDQIQSLYNVVSALPLLNNVTRESLRLIPPLHSTLRVATRTDEIPTLHPIRTNDGQDKHSFTIPKNTVVHVSLESFNLDKSVWGDDAWEFNPDRWDKLPQAVQRYPWHYSSLLSFSAGPRACPGLRFALIEIKIFYYIMLTNFVFTEADQITKHNVVLTRPYLSGKFRAGTQCPLLVSPFVRSV